MGESQSSRSTENEPHHPGGKDKENETVQNEKQEPLLREIQSFVGAIEGKNEHIVKPQEAVNVTKIAEAALLSSQKGIPIYLDLK